MKLDLRVIAPIAAVALGVLGAMRLVATGPEVETVAPKPTIPLVRTVTAAASDYRHVVIAHGTVQPRTESELVPEVSGRTEWLAPSFVSGGFFSKGDPLFRIEGGDYRIALTRAKANLARAKSEQSRATKELERQKRLAEQNVASDSRLDDATNAQTISDAARSEAVAALEQAERDLARTEIRAPYDGRVRSEKADVGQYVNKGTAIATLYAVDFAEVRLPVPDSELAFLDLPQLYQGAAADADGPEVKLVADFAGARHEWKGRIVRTEGEIDPRTRMVNVVARVAGPYKPSEEGRPPLAAGLFVEAQIHGRMDGEVFVLPRSALRGDDRMLIVDAENRLRWRTVQINRTDREQVIVRAGLKTGDQVCISALESATEGQLVRMRSAADAPKPEPATAESVDEEAGAV